MRFKAADDTPAVMPDRANRAGGGHAHVTWREPSEGTERLLTTLVVRVDARSRRESGSLVADQGLLNWQVAHGLVRQSSLRLNH